MTSDEQLSAALERIEIAHPERREYVTGNLHGYALCGLCNRAEPVGPAGEFLHPCPRVDEYVAGRLRVMNQALTYHLLANEEKTV